jgi:preprotein translocase subunit SecE
VASKDTTLSGKLLWILAFFMVGGAVSGYYYFTEYSLLLRVVGLLVCSGIAVGMVLKTPLGQRTWSQWLEAIQEVRKIYWPTRQETVQTTLAVLAMVCVMGILLWSADFFLLRVVKWLMGH